MAVICLGFPLAGLAQDQGCAEPAGWRQDQQQDQNQQQDQDQEQGQSPQPGQPVCPTSLSRALGAVDAYVTAPVRWNRTEWEYFGGTLAGIGVASHFDSSVRSELAGQSPVSPRGSSPDTLQDALPAAALFVGTWGYAKLIDDEDGIRESHAMLEAATLSLGAAEALSYITGREKPNQTLRPGHWFSGGTSFPSEHTAAAFAIGTVLAESGNYRWVRRVLGYGVAGFTAYERLKHNAHWLSDTVAGAALGAASARFAMDREHETGQEQEDALVVAPINRGVMLTYTVQLR